MVCLYPKGNAQTMQTGTLVFKADGFNNDKGKAEILLFRKTDKVPDNPFKRSASIIRNKQSIITFPDLAYGDYAAILVHDENSNGKIDHSFGLPAEQLGYTNNWELGVFTGMPSFPKLKFSFAANMQSVPVSITYKKGK